jgi:hypothetical protein
MVSGSRRSHSEEHSVQCEILMMVLVVVVEVVKE